MKRIYFFVFMGLLLTTATAQKNDSLTAVVKTIPGSGNLYNKYGDLLNDDPAYNPKSKWWKPAVRVLAADVFNWGVARYVYKFDWAKVTPADWKDHFKHGGEWDSDGFGINFIGHPHTGSFYFNVARSNGYSYWGSLPYAIEGSLIWEYFGENSKPSYNDMINTPVSGLFLGEVFYRLSSNILDDRTRGAERVFREILAGVIDPSRALNRLTQGKMFRVTNKEVYQKEPLNITLSGGIHVVNDKIGNNNKFGSGSANGTLNLQLDYGDPFEVIRRKPFDIFRLRVELSTKDDYKFLDHVNGYGLLAGKTIRSGRLLVGLFQHYDYWRNSIFEVAALGFGGGLIAKMPVAKHSNIYSTIHIAVVPLAGNNTQYGPDTSVVRHYNYGGGMQARLEETFNLNQWATIGFTGFYYFIHTYSGLPGNSLVAVLRPSLTVRLFKKLYLGLEHHIYHNDRFLKDGDNLHLTRTEQKLFLQLFFENGKRYGRYH